MLLWMVIVFGSAVGVGVILLLGLSHVFDAAVGMLHTYEAMLQNAYGQIQRRKLNEEMTTMPVGGPR